MTSKDGRIFIENVGKYLSDWVSKLKTFGAHFLKKIVTTTLKSEHPCYLKDTFTNEKKSHIP